MFAFIWVFTSKTSFILSFKQKATRGRAILLPEQEGKPSGFELETWKTIFVTVLWLWQSLEILPIPWLLHFSEWCYLSLCVTALKWQGGVRHCRDMGRFPCPTWGRGTLPTFSHHSVGGTATFGDSIPDNVHQWHHDGKGVLWRWIWGVQQGNQILLWWRLMNAWDRRCLRKYKFPTSVVLAGFWDRRTDEMICFYLHRLCLQLSARSAECDC